MSKLTIQLDKDTHDTLARLAAADYRSLTNYIQVVLMQYASKNSDAQPEKYISTPKKTIIG